MMTFSRAQVKRLTTKPRKIFNELANVLVVQGADGAERVQKYKRKLEAILNEAKSDVASHHDKGQPNNGSLLVTFNKWNSVLMKLLL